MKKPRTRVPIFSSLGRALRHRNYRLFFCGQSVSLIGSWLTRVAISWLVYRLTKSALLLGLVGFAGQIPTFLFASLAGVLVDRWNRHHVLVVTQALALVQSAMLAALTISGKITVNQLLALSVFQGCINAFDMPARQTFVVEMLESREDLPNAIALNASMVNMARLVGPSFAGILIAAFGEGGCFAIDAVSYIAVLASLLLMRLKKRSVPIHPRKHLLQELREGVEYAVKFKPVSRILLILAIVSLMGMPYMVLLPVIVSERLHGGADLLGYLTAMSGVGALVGVLYLASRKSVLGLGRVVWIAAGTFGIGLLGFSWSRWPALSMAFIFLAGMGMMVHLAAGNTILQTITDEDKRGRVMSLYTMSVAGMVPFGCLLAGVVAKTYGAPATIFVGGVACLAGSALFLRALPAIREQVRPIYASMGILPPIAKGLQETEDVE
jgi:MFS family permease